MENVQRPGAIVVEIDDEAQVQEVVRAVKKQNEQHPDHKITVRATAGWEDAQSSWGCFPWAKTQEHRYNESFSFSEGSSADVIIRFSKKYQSVKKLGTLPPKSTLSKNPLDKLPAYEVCVKAGVQIATLAQKLRELGASLRSISMLSWASFIGLIATGGNGTGYDEGSVSDQVISLRVCDHNGEIREITREHKDFATLCSAHSGALGIVLSANIRAVEAFNLQETVYNFDDVKEMGPHLGALLNENQYFTLIGVPNPVGDVDGIAKWQIRLWNYSEAERTKVQDPPYEADARSLAQELSVRVGDSIQEFLLDPKLKKLMPFYLLLSAAIITGTRGTEPIIDHENNITHYQAAFPKAMRDVSYLLPVKDNEAGPLLAAVLQKIDELVKAAGKHGEYPITYAVYTRYIKGTNGGLSPTATDSEDEHVLVLDIVTNPDAPGIEKFEKELLAYFSEINIKPRFHLGKNFPAGIESYADFLNPEALAEHRRALERWYGTEEQLKASPFITPYFEQMLQMEPALKQQLESMPLKTVSKFEVQEKEHSHEECAAFLEHLITAMQSLPLNNKKTRELKESFVTQCKETLASIKGQKEHQEVNSCVLV